MTKVIFSANEIEGFALSKAKSATPELVDKTRDKNISFCGHWVHPETGFDSYRSEFVVTIIVEDRSDV